jgi:hypothetical protein
MSTTPIPVVSLTDTSSTCSTSPPVSPGASATRLAPTYSAVAGAASVPPPTSAEWASESVAGAEVTSAPHASLAVSRTKRMGSPAVPCATMPRASSSATSEAFDPRRTSVQPAIVKSAPPRTVIVDGTMWTPVGQVSSAEMSPECVTGATSAGSHSPTGVGESSPHVAPHKSGQAHPTTTMTFAQAGFLMSVRSTPRGGFSTTIERTKAPRSFDRTGSSRHRRYSASIALS